MSHENIPIIITNQINVWSFEQNEKPVVYR